MARTALPMAIVAAAGLLLWSAAVSTSQASVIVTRLCEYYNASCVTAAKASGRDAIACYGNQTCNESSDGHNCFAVWEEAKDPFPEGLGKSHQHPSGMAVKLMGCLPKSQECDKSHECLEKDHEDDLSSGHLFCCCRGDLCNSRFRWDPPPKTPPPEISEGDGTGEKADSGVSIPGFVIAMCVAVVVAAAAGVGFFVWRSRKSARAGLQQEGRERGDGGPGAAGGPSSSSPELLERDIELLEVRATGRFGRVWRGRLNEVEVAVKVFALQERQSWKAEQEVFELPRMPHDNILGYKGVARRGQELGMEFFLLTEFHQHGSLHDYLTRSVVTWSEMCKIAHSMASGLAHLHEELPPRAGKDMKPAVAHRDFKSKNVLLKNDLTACIGDFGLALIFEPEKPIGDTYGQVGTHRYMAPEVLEGSISFSRDAFLRIDMYAFGLVLWELASRCKLGGSSGVQPSDYRLPFEEEVPPKRAPIEDMIRVVVTEKRRPAIPEAWWGHEGMAELARTIKECWDQDAEARLSASNVVERIKKLRNFPPDENRPENAGPGNPNGATSMERWLNEANRQATGHGGEESIPLIENGHVAAPDA